MKRLKEEEDRDKDTDAGGWFSPRYLFGFNPSLEEREARKRRMNERSTGRIVQENVLHREGSKLAILVSRKDDINEKIKVIQEKKAREEAARRDEATRRQQREKHADFERRQAEVRRAEEERVKRARERAQEEAQVRAKEAMERQKRAEQERPWEVHGRRSQRPSTATWKSQYEANLGGGVRAAPKSSCLHRGWWPQVDGAHLCHRCKEMTRHFAFRCPSCSKVACSGCRDILKWES